MIRQIMRDIGPYVAVYSAIVAALLLFNIVNMPNSESFGQSGTISEGMTSSLLVALQMGVMGDFDLSTYGDSPNTVAAKVVFVLFAAFGILLM